ncbi:MAG: hypothetical protein K9H64_18875 [Bacteroidales bacterium]|nr:hypothetical protein [Bacteroidales bacterium]MCF8458116.1 hypothetical protein [Bacteroidales bacterium]
MIRNFFLWFLYLLPIVVFLPFSAFGQVNTSDSIVVQNGDTIPSRFYTEILIDTMQKNYQGWEESYVDFQKRLKVKAYKSRFTKELYNLIFKNPGSKPDTITREKTRSIDVFIPHEGKLISKIVLFKLEPFGPTIDDFIREPNTWLAKMANSVQIDTRNFVVRNNLLFKEGDKLVPYNLADSERILRQLSFIRDARILVIWASETEVILLVTTKDNWSIVAGANHFSNDSNSVRFYDRNVLGMGHMLEHELLIRNNQFGYNGYYKVDNIGGSFITGSTGYTDAFSYKDYFISFDRRLLSRKIKYGGGITVQQKHSMIVDKNENKYFGSPLTYNNYDIWLGKRFCIVPRTKKCPDNIELLWSVRYENQFFIERPNVDAFTNFYYHDREFYITSIGFAKRNYYTARLINYFGVNEDIPTGFKFELKAGFEKREFYNRPYTGISFLRSNYFKYGYYSLLLEYGSFFRHGHAEQGVVSATLSGFGNGLSFGRYRYRPFFRLNYSTGINRLYGQTINLNGENGITSLLGETNGLHRLAFKHESVLFQMKKFADFHFALTAFTDMGFMGSQKSFFDQYDFYSGLGLGIRINNHNLFFQTIQLNFAWFPVVPINGSEYRMNIGNSSKFQFRDFIMEKPDILPYN